MNTSGFAGSVKALSDTEVRITLDKPESVNALSYLSGTMIVPKHVWEKIDDPVTYTNKDAVGSGPFTVKGGNFSPTAYTFKKNPYYWDEGKPEIDGVRYVLITGGTQASQNALTAGDVDWMSAIFPNMDDVLSEYPDIKTVNVPSSQMAFMTCSNKELGCSGPITDPAVRKAIYYALDRNQINKLALNGQYSELAGSLYPYGQFTKYASDDVPDSPIPGKGRTDEAVKILEDAGYTKGDDGITLTEFDVKTMKLKPETERTIWRGTDVKLTEGPHLYKINGYYYLFAAEGGTVYTHQEVVARSKSLDALSFEGMPSNPFITNFDTPRSYLQKQGHGALVDTPSGEWYYASLCGRPWHHDNESFTDPRGWCTLGRETSIQKVEWTEDGWPYIVGGHGGQRYVDAPKDAIETEAPADHSQHDDFMSDTLDLNWNTLRVPFDGEMGKVGGGVLELRGQGSLCNLFDLSLVARRWQAFNFDATVKVEFDPKNYRQMAGLTNYYDDLCWSWVFVTWDERRQCRVIEVAQNDFNNYTSFLRDTAPAVPDDVKSVWLRTKVRKQWYSYEYSFDGTSWVDLGVKLDAKILSDDYILRRYGGFFTGAFVGLAAIDLSGYDRVAKFSEFDYRELPDNE